MLQIFSNIIISAQPASYVITFFMNLSSMINVKH